MRAPLAAALQGALSDSPDRTAYLDRLSADFATGNGRVKGCGNFHPTLSIGI